MIHELLEQCLEEIFTDENIIIIWENRNSIEDIIDLNTYLPIRYKKNDLNGRNVEILLQSEVGDYTSTIILVENDNFFFPNNLYKLANSYFMEYTKVHNLSQSFRREYQILMGAFSIQSYYQALYTQNEKPYYSYDIKFKISQSLDGLLKTFVDESYFDKYSLDTIVLTSLDEVSISAFKEDNTFENTFLPTAYTRKWVEILKKKRLLELYTICI